MGPEWIAVSVLIVVVIIIIVIVMFGGSEGFAGSKLFAKLHPPGKSD